MNSSNIHQLLLYRLSQLFWKVCKTVYCFNVWCYLSVDIFSAPATMESLTLILAVIGWVLFFLLVLFDILAIVFIIKKQSGIIVLHMHKNFTTYWMHNFFQVQRGLIIGMVKLLQHTSTNFILYVYHLSVPRMMLV